MPIKVVSKIVDLEGFWFVACIESLNYSIKDSNIYIKCLLVKLVDYYSPNFGPYHMGSIDWHSKVEKKAKCCYYCFPIKAACSLYPGLVLEDGKALKKHEHAYMDQPSNLFEINLKGNPNTAKKLKYHSNAAPKWTSHPEVFGEIHYTKLTNQDFQLESAENEPIEEVYVPSFEIFRHLYLRSSRLTEEFLKNSFVLDDMVKKSQLRSEERKYYIHTSLNYKPIEFDVLASILCQNFREMHFNYTWGKLFKKEYQDIGVGQFKCYLPKHLKKITCSGMIIQVEGKKALLCYHLSKSLIDYPYDELEFISDQDGRQKIGEDGVKKYIKKLRKKYGGKSDDIEGDIPSDYESEFELGSIPVLEQGFIDEVRFPSSSRLERDDQESMTISGNPKDEKPVKKVTFGSKSGSDPELPSRLEIELRKEQKEKEIRMALIAYVTMFYELQEHLSEFFTIDQVYYLQNNFSSKDINDNFRNQYLCDYNSLDSLPSFNPDQKHFCQYYKKENQNVWSGHRGICVVRVGHKNESIYLIEIEPRLRPSSIDSFFLLAVYNTNLKSISNSQLRLLVDLAGKYMGVWKNAKEEISNLGLNMHLFRHNGNTLITSAFEKCTKIFSLK